MSMSGLHRRVAKWVSVGVGTGLIASALFATTGAVAASAASITQAAPLQGVTLIGTAFTDQLAVSGATGGVTFSQESGSDSVSVSSAGVVTANASLQAGSYTASGNDSDASGDSGTWSYTLNVLKPAPQGFGTTVDNVYGSIFSVGQQLGQSSAMQPLAAYQQNISQLSDTQLAAYYSAAQQNPEWYQIPALMQTVASGVQGANVPSATKLSTTGAAAASGSVKKGAKSTTHGISNGAGPHVAPFIPQTCPDGIPDSAIFALQIVIDVSQGLYNVLAALSSAFADAIDAQVGIGLSAAATGVVLAVATIVHDVLVFEQQLANDCASNNLAGYVANIDNTTTQDYGLVTTLASAIAQLQTDDVSNTQNIQNIQTQLTSFQTTVLQTIATDTQTLQTAVGSVTQGLTTQLQTDVTALTQDSTSLGADVTTISSTVINQVNADSSGVQAALSLDLTQLLNEMDTDAKGLTTLITQDNQQVLNAVQANFTTQQTEYYANLTLQIQQGLALWGSRVPEVQFMLPATMGGYLNSTPVGVQEVVTSGLNALVAIGVKVSATAAKDLTAANTALTAKQYTTAYADYALCYEAYA